MSARVLAQNPAGPTLQSPDPESLTSISNWPATRITGFVRDESGKPVTGVVVSFIPGHFPVANSYSATNTDLNGRYDLILPASNFHGGWRGGYQPTNAILARSFELNLATIEAFYRIPDRLNLTLRPGIKLTGSLQDTDGVPITNATVALVLFWRGYGVRLDGWQQASRQPQMVDAHGLFSFPALPQDLEYDFNESGIFAEGFGSTHAGVGAELTHTDHYEFPALVLKRANLVLAGQVFGSGWKTCRRRDGKFLVVRPSVRASEDDFRPLRPFRVSRRGGRKSHSFSLEAAALWDESRHHTSQRRRHQSRPSPAAILECKPLCRESSKKMGSAVSIKACTKKNRRHENRF